MTKKYITKTVVIEAIKWTGLNLKEVKEFVGESLIYDINDIAWKVGEGSPSVYLQIKTLEGVMKCMLGDYIIKGTQGEFYPCKPVVFKKKYERLESAE